jgi:hypothetical protein
MYLSYYERHGVGSTIRIGDFAAEALRQEPHIVAEQVIEHLKMLSKQQPFIVTQ